MFLRGLDEGIWGFLDTFLSFIAYPHAPNTVIITSLRASLSKGKCAGPNTDTNGKLIRTTHGCKIPLVRTMNYNSEGVPLDLSPCWNSTIIYKFKSSTWEAYCSWAAIMRQLKHFPSTVVSWKKHHRDRNSGWKEIRKVLCALLSSQMCAELKFWENLNQETYFPRTLNFSLFKRFGIFETITFNEPSSNSTFWYTILYLTT